MEVPGGAAVAIKTGGVCIDLWEDLRSRGRHLVASLRRTFVRKRPSSNSSHSDCSFDPDDEFQGNAETSSGGESWGDSEASDSQGSYEDSGRRIRYRYRREENQLGDPLGSGADEDPIVSDTNGTSSEVGDSDSEIGFELEFDPSNCLDVQFWLGS